MKKLILMLFFFLLILITVYSAKQYVQKAELSPTKEGNALLSNPIINWAKENLGVGSMNSKDLTIAKNMEIELKNQVKNAGESK